MGSSVESLSCEFVAKLVNKDPESIRSRLRVRHLGPRVPIHFVFLWCVEAIRGKAGLKILLEAPSEAARKKLLEEVQPEIDRRIEAIFDAYHPKTNRGYPTGGDPEEINNISNMISDDEINENKKSSGSPPKTHFNDRGKFTNRRYRMVDHKVLLEVLRSERDALSSERPQWIKLTDDRVKTLGIPTAKLVSLIRRNIVNGKGGEGHPWVIHVDSLERLQNDQGLRDKHIAPDGMAGVIQDFQRRAKQVFHVDYKVTGKDAGLLKYVMKSKGETRETLAPLILRFLIGTRDDSGKSSLGRYYRREEFSLASFCATIDQLKILYEDEVRSRESFLRERYRRGHELTDDYIKERALQSDDPKFYVGGRATVWIADDLMLRTWQEARRRVLANPPTASRGRSVIEEIFAGIDL